MTTTEIKRAGKEAFQRGELTGDCPYTFQQSEFWKARDYDGFNTVRWKLDAWMAGWIEGQREARVTSEQVVERKLRYSRKKLYGRTRKMLRG